MSRIELHVERLVLEDVAPRDRAAIADAFQRALAQRLTTVLANGTRFTGLECTVAAPAAIEVPLRRNPADVGAALAGAICARLEP